jgi:hypothetical protein
MTERMEIQLPQRQGWDSYFLFEAINIIATLYKKEAIYIIATYKKM